MTTFQTHSDNQEKHELTTKTKQKMKKIIFYCVTIVFFGAINSCCTKKYCLGFDNLNEIQLLNFTANDVDSIGLEIFVSGSNFTNRIDSSFTSAHGRTTGDTVLIIFMPEKISKSHEYKFTLLSTGQVYKLSNFEIRNEECNCPSDKYNVLDSYVINGQKINSSSLTISN
jgi:hypothetical protein